MAAFYNEIDPFAGRWLRNLIDAGHIAKGKIRRGDIKKIEGKDVERFTQAHFFAGVGVWSYALRQAGWPDQLPCWTGSCPCQPFSQAGRRKGVDDERHLWPTWARLIERVQPPAIFGEQVASPDGREWLDTVLTQLEGMGYEVGATDLCAAGIGAPHLRQRLYFVAIANGKRRERLRLHLRKWEERKHLLEARRGSEARVLGDTSGKRSGRDAGTISGEKRKSKSERLEVGSQSHKSRVASAARGMEDADEFDALDGEKSRSWRLVQPKTHAARGFWAGADWIFCRDGKWRPVESGTFPLAHGATQRVGRLRAYGNAIVAPQATAFVETVMEWLLDG